MGDILHLSWTVRSCGPPRSCCHYEPEIANLRLTGCWPVDLVEDAVTQRDPYPAGAERGRHAVATMSFALDVQVGREPGPPGALVVPISLPHLVVSPTRLAYASSKMMASGLLGYAVAATSWHRLPEADRGGTFPNASLAPPPFPDARE